MARASSLGTPRFVLVKQIVHGWIQCWANWLKEDLMSLSSDSNVSTFRDMTPTFQFDLGVVTALVPTFPAPSSLNCNNYVVALRPLTPHKTNPLSFLFLVFWPAYSEFGNTYGYIIFKTRENAIKTLNSLLCIKSTIFHSYHMVHNT